MELMIIGRLHYTKDILIMKMSWFTSILYVRKIKRHKKILLLMKWRYKFLKDHSEVIFELGVGKYI
ncbi:hypothetical protein D8675_21355 [Enterobacter roggenkampii]|nr:hypothetical protein D8675_21355 [Enterobacter roggenkampii]